MKENYIWKRKVCDSEAEYVAKPRNPEKQNDVHILPHFF
jgi:hypothetical protein